jgi:hypothetical protein
MSFEEYKAMELLQGKILLGNLMENSTSDDEEFSVSNYPSEN